MAGISPQILGGITPIQFRFLYKASGGFISPTYQIFELSRLPKSLNFQEALEVTLVLIFVSFFVLRLFSLLPVSLAFCPLFLFLTKISFTSP